MALVLVLVLVLVFGLGLWSLIFGLGRGLGLGLGPPGGLGSSRCWSLVVGRWSLVVGRWSLVSLSLVFDLVSFCVLCMFVSCVAASHPLDKRERERKEKRKKKEKKRGAFRLCEVYIRFLCTWSAFVTVCDVEATKSC